ncbi:putative diguanylate cyclase YeaP [mine drainage metagenome]|uniref:Putative diguanylate cyclase YeaP n=1 Tax=mine drainage metagenome TaxID=410659 RepID=A0A1J5P8V6_9ZZZZ
MDPHVLFEPIRDEAGQIVDLSYLDANRAACEYMNIAHDKLIGMRLLEILPGHVESGTLARYIEVIESGRPLALDRYAYQNEILGSVSFSDIRAIRVGDLMVLNWRDVTDRYAADVALAASEEQYRLLAENSSDVVLRLNMGVVGWISPSITDMLGWNQSDLLDKHLDELILPEDLEKFLDCQLTISNEEHLHVTRFRMLAKDKSYHWIEIRAKRYINASGEWDGAVASFHTIDAQVAAEQSLERRARHDELTGLLNRNDMLDRLSAISSHSLRTGHEIAVMFCDVDAFKSVNDTRGHATGDQVLRTIATRIEGSVRSGDLIARIGGDEFVIIIGFLDGDNLAPQLQLVLERLHEAIETPFDIEEGQLAWVGMSMGVALYPDDGTESDLLLRRADAALYRAKTHKQTQGLWWRRWIEESNTVKPMKP